MKKLIKLLSLAIVLFTSTSCLKMDSMEGINILVSTYPIEYIVKRLYGNYSNITSVYPSGVDTNNYELTDKQINDYAKNNTLFVYNGLSDEKQMARDFLNINKKMKIIDVSYGLNTEYGSSYEELWLSPNNYLMLATTVKNNLSDFIDSKYLLQEIENNYATLQEDLSLLDANMRSIGSSSTRTIVTTIDVLEYLENYGFDVLVINESNINDDIKNNFRNGTYGSLFIKKDETSDLITDLVSNYSASTVSVDLMNVLDETSKKNNDDYLTIMNEYVRNLREAGIKE